MSRKYVRRSLLYIPGSSEKMLSKAADVTSDGVILELEDAVSIAEKDMARELVISCLKKLKGIKKEVIVRVNAMDTIWGIRDILGVAGCAPDAVIVPKADEKAIIMADGLLSAAENEAGLTPGTVSIIPLFETAYSIANPMAILSASARIDGVQLGGEDLTKEQEITRTFEGEEIRYARQQLAMAARARKIDIIDTPFTAIRDMDGLRRDAETAKQIGYTGKACIHPSHTAVVNEVFSPTPEEVEDSRRVLEAYEAGVRQGKGAVMYQNKMIDAPIAERARRILKKAEHIGMA